MQKKERRENNGKPIQTIKHINTIDWIQTTAIWEEEVSALNEEMKKQERKIAYIL